MINTEKLSFALGMVAVFVLVFLGLSFDIFNIERKKVNLL